MTTDAASDATESTTPPPPVCIVASRYNARITDAMTRDAERIYVQRGGDADALGVIDAAGTFELPALCGAAARSGLYRGVLAIGCVVRGETEHDRYIASAVSTALAELSAMTGAPIAFGVLTVNTPDQAIERANTKGAEAMHALLDTVAGIDALSEARRDNHPGVRFALAPSTDKTAAGGA